MNVKNVSLNVVPGWYDVINCIELLLRVSFWRSLSYKMFVAGIWQTTFLRPCR